MHSFQIDIERFVPRLKEFEWSEPLSFSIKQHENWAFIGPNGAGKTLITDIIQGKIFPRQGEVRITSTEERPAYQLIRSISFRDIYSLTDCREMYYQQRWNSFDAETTPIARSLLKGCSDEAIEKYAQLFDIGELLDKHLVALSSGELRKFLITKVLMTEPRLLILDNPFIGLDAPSRATLNAMLRQTMELTNMQILFVVSHPKDLPEWIDYVLPIKERSCYPAQKVDDFLQDKKLIHTLFSEIDEVMTDLPRQEEKEVDYQTAIRMERIHIRYGAHTILKDEDWEVKSGERWALLGGNGSGKSTLLSLVCGDNPQAYANNLTLFDRKRGSGESIWDIKKRIGYLSPDIHTYYMQDTPCFNVAASGFFDSIGLYQKCNDVQKEETEKWMKIFHANHLANRSFVKISYGEQRLILLVRAFVKNPELLILDEPLHGLDAGKKQLAKRIIESYCSQKGKTLIYVTHYEEEIPSIIDRRKILTKRKNQ